MNEFLSHNHPPTNAYFNFKPFIKDQPTLTSSLHEHTMNLKNQLTAMSPKNHAKGRAQGLEVEYLKTKAGLN